MRLKHQKTIAALQGENVQPDSEDFRFRRLAVLAGLTAIALVILAITFTMIWDNYYDPPVCNEGEVVLYTDVNTAGYDVACVSLDALIESISG